MDPQNYGPDYILGRDLKVLSRQSVDSLLLFSVGACSILSRQYLFLQHVYSVVTDLSMALSHFVLQGLSFCPFYAAIFSCVFTGTIMLRH